MAKASRTRRRWSLLLICLVATIAALGVLALAIGAGLDPTGSYFATISSSLWTTLGPHFVVVGMLAALIGVFVWYRGTRWLGQITTFVSVLSFLGAVYIVGSIMAAVATAGGSVNPLNGLLLGKMGEPPPDRTETVTTVEDQELKAAIYLPTGNPKNTPVLVYIHGGGFMIGTNTETAADLRWFADRGWAVFSIDYRLFTLGNPTWEKAPADVACGLAWVHSNAMRFGGDPQRIVVLGDSAGGNLAINLSYAAALGKVQSTCGPVPVPQAVIVQYPVVEVTAIYERGYPVPGFEPKMLVEGYIGGTPEEYPERVKSVSSATYLSDNAPPTLVIEPEKDGLVVSDSVYAFVDSAMAAGVDIEMVRIPFANHVYNQIAAGSIGNQARLTITERYLRRHGLAP